MNPLSAINQARTFSLYLDRILSAHPDLLSSLQSNLSKPIQRQDFERFSNWSNIQNSEELMTKLRKLRQETMARLIVRDLSGMADLDEVVSSISEFADFALEQALRITRFKLADFAQPIGEYSQQVQTLIVIAMGKLGGRELNVSSDIDLIFVYPEEGKTNGTRQLSNHEYFIRQSKEIIRIINDITPEGQVFRVDMRLRPYGESGALAISMAALENYLITQGREWERYAWIKARPISGSADALNELVRPFVYRKYLDYNAYGAMRELHSQIRREVSKRGMADNIKLGAGGIREIEFIVQLFQLVRGGREKSLRQNSTRSTLQSLDKLRLLDAKAIDELSAAYTFLRNLEHRLQYIDDQQTQTLVSAEPSRQKIALSMNCPDWDAFIKQLNQHRAVVSNQFEQIFLLPEENHFSAEQTKFCWREADNSDIAKMLIDIGFSNTEKIQQLLRSLYASPNYKQMPESGHKKLEALINPLLHAAKDTANPELTLSRLLGLLEAIGRRVAYLALLTEHPHTLKHLAKLYGASNWVSSYITRHPILLDELIAWREMENKPNWQQLKTQLWQQLNDCEDQDIESKMDVLRHFQHAQIFRLATQDLAGIWTIEAISDQLSQLADIVLEATLHHAWRSIPKRHCDEAKFAIIAYGKLGGKELGYSSDLDIIFIYQDEHPSAAELYAKLARRMSGWLTSATSAGNLYEIDLRLRPNGSSGMLVSTLSAFANYQHDKAWVWEHQALTRARYVAGDKIIGNSFEALRHELLIKPREQLALGKAVVEVREKIFPTHPPVDSDIKYARGGIVDVEFIVQYLILQYAKTLPELTKNSGNIALLAIAAEAGLIDQELANQVRFAYRYYRSLQHAFKLRDSKQGEVDEQLTNHYKNVRKLWNKIFSS